MRLHKCGLKLMGRALHPARGFFWEEKSELGEKSGKKCRKPFILLCLSCSQPDAFNVFWVRHRCKLERARATMKNAFMCSLAFALSRWSLLIVFSWPYSEQILRTVFYPHSCVLFHVTEHVLLLIQSDNILKREIENWGTHEQKNGLQHKFIYLLMWNPVGTVQILQNSILKLRILNKRLRVQYNKEEDRCT